MEKIDLNAIIEKVDEDGNYSSEEQFNKLCMKKVIHQVLVLASENAELNTDSKMPSRGYPYGMINQKPNANPEEYCFIVDKQSILDVEKLIK